MIEIFERNWLSRIAKYDSEGLSIETPEIMFISTESIKAPEYARLVISDGSGTVPNGSASIQILESRFFDSSRSVYPGINPRFRGGVDTSDSAEQAGIPAIFLESNHRPSDSEIIPIGDSLLLSRNPRNFFSKIACLRGNLGPDRLIYLSGIADPINLSLLCYLGGDLFDSYGTLMRSSLGQILLNGHLIRRDSTELDRIPDLGREPTFEKIYYHNLRQLEHELLVVREAIRKGTLRELVEIRARHESWLMQLLRIADREGYSIIEPWTGVSGGAFLASSKESLWRPDIERFRRRLSERYIPPASPEILVLLPCSARKPYSTSRTHRMFIESIRRTGLGATVHEVIVTSPLGIVPRELERVYPAQQYDIPVTGHWDEDEKEMIRSMVGNLLDKKKYSHIIAHLDGEMEFLEDLLAEAGAVRTGGDNATSSESLRSLEENLSQLIDTTERTAWKQRTFEDITAIASYQFGNASQTIMNQSEVRGRYPNIKVLREGNQLCSLVPDRGYLALTLNGGIALSESGSYGVEIDDFAPKSNIFAIGVLDANPEIRAGDEVYVHHDDDVRAVGVARMNPSEMNSLNRGEAVHVRHYK